MLVLLAASSCGRREPPRGSGACESPIDLAEAATRDPDGTLRIAGTLPGATSVHRGSCGGSGAEVVLRYVPERSGSLVLSTDNPGTAFDTVLYVRSVCDDADREIDCDDDGASGLASMIVFEAIGGAPIFIFVDAFGSGGGAWELTVREAGVTPGDGGTIVPDGGAGGPPSSCDSPIDIGARGTRESDGSLRYADSNRDGLWASQGSCGGRGPDSVLVYTPERSGILTASTDDPGTSFDTVVYVRLECTMPTTEIACDDDAGASVSSEARASVTAGTPVYIFVDGYGSRSEGDYVLRVRIDDAPADGGVPDGGPFDGGTFDAGPSDGGSVDAGPMDGGSCSAGTADCDGIGANGCETSITSSVAHCGGCGMACVTRPNSVPSCAMSVCDFTCSSGYDDCNRVFTDGCEIDTAASPSNCGTCGNDCPTVPSSVRTCTSGTCGFACLGAFDDCNASAVDGCETSTDTDLAHCGGCGMACSLRANATNFCAASACGFSCTAPFDDCNATPSDGCETNTSSTVAHCGGCGAACAARPNTTPSCASSACAYACNTGFADCNAVAGDGCEADLGADAANCGTCGRLCPGMQVCCAGTCRTSCT